MMDREIPPRQVAAGRQHRSVQVGAGSSNLPHYLHSWWLRSETCTGGLVPSSTDVYAACSDCNLHCVVMVVVVYICIYIQYVIVSSEGKCIVNVCE